MSIRQRYTYEEALELVKLAMLAYGHDALDVKQVIRSIRKDELDLCLGIVNKIRKGVMSPLAKKQLKLAMTEYSARRTVRV
jgi:hypothetical protein